MLERALHRRFIRAVRWNEQRVGAAKGLKAMLRYVNPNANWSSYTKIMIAPVTYWAADDSKVSAADQHALCDYMYIVLGKDLGKNFVIVDQPGPGVIKVSAALWWKNTAASTSDSCPARTSSSRSVCGAPGSRCTT